MQTITIVTGNPGKVSELQAMAVSKLDFVMLDVDLPEIQSLDSKEIVKDKIERAYAVIKKPVIVEDVSAGLDRLNGLPGPFIKFFDKALGGAALYKLAETKDEKVTITCTVAYYDGKQMLFGEGIIYGTVVSPRGSNGFGFDPVVIPKGETRTMAEMSQDEKLMISHRGKAFRSLLQQIEKL